jgi:hypothetical protein
LAAFLHNLALVNEERNRKMNHILAYLLPALLFFYSCSASEPPEQQETNVVEPVVRPTGQGVAVILPRFELKERPEVGSKTLQVLERGDSLYLQGQVSNNRNQLSIGGKSYDRSWLLCQTAKGLEGWVHGAAVEEGLPLRLQLQAHLEGGLAEAAWAYVQSFAKMSSAESVVQVLRQAHQLGGNLSQYPGLEAEAQDLNALLPGLQTTWLEERQRYAWYVDYRAFLPAALASAAPADEELLELYYLAYPLDSIAYRYPAWMIETAPGEAYSLLGRGDYLLFLEALEQRQAYASLIQPELQQLRQLLLNDIRTAGVSFWEKRERVLAELRQLAQAEALDASLRNELTQRLKLWTADSLNQDLSFNHRAGLHNN